MIGPAWFTTIQAALNRANKPHKLGRVLRRTGA
jgi:hypothetical protein